MARLLKERARKPVIENATAYPGTKFLDNEMYLTIEVGEPWYHGKQTTYIAALTRSEAMRVMGKWMEVIAMDDTRKREAHHV
jgi:hypothetical protein